MPREGCRDILGGDRGGRCCAGAEAETTELTGEPGRSARERGRETALARGTGLSGAAEGARALAEADRCLLGCALG